MNIFTTNKKTCMEKEIYEQAQIAHTILEEYVSNNTTILLEIPQGIKRIIIVASGSSYNCARYGANLFGSLAGLEAQAIYSSEFLLKDSPAHSENVLYIFITQSGETTDTNKALEIAKKYGVKTLCITNKENSTIWNATDHKIACHAGEECSIAATKSFTSQLLCITLLALKFAQINNIDISKHLSELKSIPEIIRKTYDLRPQIKQFAKFLSKFNNIIITADGSSYSMAKEASLKIKETSYINTTSYILGEFMHGHVAVLNNKKTVLIYVLNDDLTYTAIKNLEKIKNNYNPPICIIGNRTNQVRYSYHLNLNNAVSPLVKTFSNAIIIQLIALETALKLDRNVDKPKGLQKVVQ